MADSELRWHGSQAAHMSSPYGAPERRLRHDDDTLDTSSYLASAPLSPGANLYKALPPPPMDRPSLDEMGDLGAQVRNSRSWMDLNNSADMGDDDTLEYLRSHQAAALPTSLYTSDRSRAKSGSAAVSQDDPGSPFFDRQQPMAQHTSSHFDSLAYMVSPPTLAPQHIYNHHSPLLRSVSEGESSFQPESPPTRSFARPPKVPSGLPDPSHFPDPYPFRAPHHHLTSGPPALSSAGSSSASTRSSAYTSFGSALASGDYGDVHVASGDEEAVGVAVGITSDDVVQMMANEPAAAASALGPAGRMPIDQTRWSDYSASLRSRSSGVPQSNTNSTHEPSPRLTQQASYDMGWQSVDERDEAGLLSEEETDDDATGDDLGDDDDDEEKEEERTAAIVIAEEGRGLIVRGDGVPIVQLQVDPGTTHLLVGSSSTPNAMPNFLALNLPQICNTLLALDISANFLVAIPPALAACTCLEELNIASNPLRVLPVFLSHLTSLRVLIADATGISTLPETYCELDKLHTLSVRRNKMNSLPSWLCLLFSLQTLYVDGNPFQGPWKALVDPLLAKTPMSPAYPPSTPMWPLPSASTIAPSSATGTETDTTDDTSDPPTSDQGHRYDEGEDTITPERGAQPLMRSVTAPNSALFGPSHESQIPAPARQGLTRTRTTPNRPAYMKSRTASGEPPKEPRTPASAQLPSFREQLSSFPDQQVRKMKSAGDLRNNHLDVAAIPEAVPRSPPIGTPNRPSLTQYVSSTSNSNMLHVSEGQPEPVVAPKRFASLGRSPARSVSGSRPALTQSLWDQISEGEDEGGPSPLESRNSSVTSPTTPARNFAREQRQSGADTSPQDRYSSSRSSKDGKDKSYRWGFLKKMSMGKMRVDSPSTSGRVTPMNSRPQLEPVSLFDAAANQPIERPKTGNTSPRIEMRFSTTGALGPIPSSPSVAISPPHFEQKASNNMLKSSAAPSAFPGGLLVPPTSPTPRAAKRRSFLPIDTPLQLSIPSPSDFVPDISTTQAEECSESVREQAPSPVPDNVEFSHREEERQREASTRALRSVMAYLKDMNDLNQTPTNPLSMYGSSASEELLGSGSRSRRPTMVETGRGVSESAVSTLIGSGSFGQLRATDMRTGNVPMSTVTTDSSGSGEERKWKDDRSKRALVVREIVETERTYVKGLEELVDIYIKPAAASVNMLSGVGSSKDTIIPVAERKIVFNGLDALFSFHKESFLPALEIAAAPVMKSAGELQAADADGQLSMNVVKAVAGMFLKHAAFMKMYSSYINNFDNALQRVKYWTTDRPAPGPSGLPAAMSPASSTAQLVGLGLTMSAVSNPGMLDAGTSSNGGMPILSTSQKKRIKSYLKRCRMNPRHSQLNMEGYLLLPVQRIPRYKLLLEELLRSTPPSREYAEDPLDKALAEISSLANNMNEGKRESESRRKLVQWQARIRGRFPSPLVQPHRRLIMDGPLRLTRVVRKAAVSFEAISAMGDTATVQVDCLAPELTPRALVGILCNDLLVLCRDPSEGKDLAGPVDLWAVLRMQTLPQPASIVHGNALRLVDNKAILYFDAPTPSDALNWFRAINLHIPASKT